MKSDVVQICIGYDPREAIAYQVLTHSLITRSSKPLKIVPIALGNLKKEMWRERAQFQSTDFSFSRFLTPFLCDYEGWAIFMDCDILALDDIAKLWALRDDRWSVLCVQHDHRPAGQSKFLGEIQTQYEKKNWSSVMLFNNQKCKALTPEYVNQASGLELHRFKWLDNDDLIGAIPRRWNHLVGYDKAELADISLLHFTEGGPYFSGYEQTEFADLWHAELAGMMRVAGKTS